jgi:hypothetical protein
MWFKYNVSSVLINLPDLPINALKMCGHIDLPIGVVYSIEERRLAKIVLHVTFMDYEPIKVE